MTKRARRSNYWLSEPQLPRLREFREARALSEAALSKLILDRTGVRISPSQVHRIEVGDTVLTPDKAQVFAAALDVATSDLYADMPLTVPLLYRVGRRQPGDPPAASAAPRARRSAPHHLHAAIQCFAAVVADDSADRLGYPQDSVLFVRPPDAIGGFEFGSLLLVATYEGEPGRGPIAEIFVGQFQPTALGDLMVHTRSSNRLVPAAIRVREGAAAPGFSDVPALYEPGRVSYVPRTTDQAVILGRVEAASVPVAPAIAERR